MQVHAATALAMTHCLQPTASVCTPHKLPYTLSIHKIASRSLPWHCHMTGQHGIFTFVVNAYELCLAARVAACYSQKPSRALSWHSARWRQNKGWACTVAQNQLETGSGERMLSFTRTTSAGHGPCRRRRPWLACTHGAEDAVVAQRQRHRATACACPPPVRRNHQPGCVSLQPRGIQMH